MADCKLCGAPHAACGPSTTVVPIDERVTLRKEGAMGDLKRYNVLIPGRHGRTTEATLLLSDEDAKAQSLTEKDLAGKTAPTNKAAKPEGNKAAPKPAAKTPAKAPAAKKPAAKKPAAKEPPADENAPAGDADSDQSGDGSTDDAGTPAE